MPEQTDPTSISIPSDLATELAHDMGVARQELAIVMAALIELEFAAKAEELMLARFGGVGLGERMSEKEYLVKLLEGAGLGAMRAFRALGGSRAEIETAINERFDEAQAERALAWLEAVPAKGEA